MEMGTYEVGDAFLNVVGPLGHPTEIENFGTVVCVGGGVGIAPVYPIAKAAAVTTIALQAPITAASTRCRTSMVHVVRPLSNRP